MTSYRDAGVDLDGAREHTSSISRAVTSTWSDEVVGMFGDFAAGIEVPGGFRRPVLMMTTDGVGTKLEIARRSGIWEGVGFDLVAMCVDDLAAVGARPLAFVDYMAVGSLKGDRDTAIVESISRACVAAGCALLGGETAEHPGLMAGDAVDLAGAALGVVEKGEQLGPHLVRAGDVVIGLESPNLRSNGFSLVREVMGDEVGRYAPALLDPSVIYSKSVLAAVDAGGVHAAAHITGGGIAENLERVLPSGLGVEIDTSAWSIPSVFTLISGRGIEPEEMFRVFNMGIGFCLVVEAEVVDRQLDLLRAHRPSRLGVVEAEKTIALV